MGKYAKSGVVLFGLCATLVITGCESDVEDTPISRACTQAFEDLRQISDAMYAAEAAGRTFTDAEWNSIDVAPLQTCTSANEWLAAGKQNPGALGFTHPDAIDETVLGVFCYGDDVTRTAVCVDAAAKGIEAP
ncbi:hypothetical protein [Arthrobacter sp. zg-Y769]|uniref:hypothetical protein n=1 Tax=Arthrobacter sp. zg-Y769 TaxID=2894191 RepID=UPI001E2EC9CD|nr:hypothetical protein [Arthrobacter sp. zg-Y769]MCC9204274.1 hypothetical protein [Arthrobacter sp. zg-Y769]